MPMSSPLVDRSVSPRFSPTAAGRIDALLGAAIARGDVPGVVAMAFDANEVLYASSAGRRGLGPGAAPMTLDTVIWYASMTKATVAAGAMLLVQRGQAELDAPVDKVLPELANPQVMEGFDANGAARLRPARGHITLRQLLTHTSGFGYDIWHDDVRRYMDDNGLITLAQCRKASLMVPLVADPGTAWNYGISIDWAGQFIEAIVGQRLGQFLKQELFEPLGMVDTDFGLGPAQRARQSELHQREPDGTLHATPDELTDEPEFHMGGGGEYGTVPDYTRVLQMLLNGGRTPSGQVIFTAETLRQMFGNNIGELRAGVLRPVIRHLAVDSDFFPAMTQKWGLSFLINPEPSPHGRSAGSLSWAGLANSYYWIDPARGVGGVIAAQVLPFADPLMVRLYEQFERAFYDGLGEPARLAS
jgi:CubicO group peptidase (beta-lactamase class C family)